MIFSHYSTVTTNNVQKEFTQMGIEGLFYDCMPSVEVKIEIHIILNFILLQSSSLYPIKLELIKDENTNKTQLGHWF